MIVLAEWYNVDVMRKIKFFDDNTRRPWVPITGFVCLFVLTRSSGANIPALNGLLEPFGIAFGDRIYNGELNMMSDKKVTVSDEHISLLIIKYYSGTSIVRFPKQGHLVSFALEDQTEHILRQASRTETVPVLGLLKSGKGSVTVFGDSSCFDSVVSGQKSYWLLEHFLDFGAKRKVPSAIAGLSTYKELIDEPFRTDTALPDRMSDSLLSPFSKVPQGHAIVSASEAVQEHRNNTFGGKKIQYVVDDENNEKIRETRWNRMLLIPFFAMFGIIVFLIYISAWARRSPRTTPNVAYLRSSLPLGVLSGISSTNARKGDFQQQPV